MKILFVIPTLSSWPFISKLALGLRDKGWEVHIAASTFKLRDSAESKEIELIFHHDVSIPRGANAFKHFRASQQLNEVVKKVQPDIVDIHFSAAMFASAIAKNKHWPYTSATVQGLRFPMLTGARGKLEKFAETWAARKMDSVFVLSSDDLEALHAENVPNARQQKAYGFGCDLSRFDPGSISSADKKKALEAVNGAADEFRIIYVGRCAAFKGFHIAVKAFLELAKKRDDVRLIVCGGFDETHPIGLDAVEMNTIQNHPQISLVGWTKTPETYLAISDVTLFPSSREGMPVNLMESLAMGVPVVTLDSRGCRDVVTDGETGLVLKDNNPASFASAIESLIENKSQLSEYAQNAATDRAKFGRQKYVDERIAHFTKKANLN